MNVRAKESTAQCYFVNNKIKLGPNDRDSIPVSGTSDRSHLCLSHASDRL